MNTRYRLFAILLLIWQAPAFGVVTFTSNPGPAYPPGCINQPLQHLDLQAGNVAHFYSEPIWLEVASKVAGGVNLGQMQLDMYRVGCAEPNRSVIIAEFKLPLAWSDLRQAQLMLPSIAGVTGFDPYPLEFKPEANAWGRAPSQYLLTQNSIGDYADGWNDPRRFTWRYVLDVSPAAANWDRDDAPKYYNGEFGLAFYRSTGQEFHSILVPATEAVLQPAADVPLSGRLSGHWVEDGSADQGLLISFNSLLAGGTVADQQTADLLVFLSWYTFDSDGKMLWLTGAARYAQGSAEVTIPMELVAGGSFLGSVRARRATLGTVRLQAFNCNLLLLDYQLEELGLGSGEMHLERLIALEIADFPCRDYEGLQSSIYPPESD